MSRTRCSALYDPSYEDDSAVATSGGASAAAHTLLPRIFGFGMSRMQEIAMARHARPASGHTALLRARDIWRMPLA